MHFPIPCYASMHCWKNSSGMLLSSFVMAFLKASLPSLDDPIELGEKKKSYKAKSGRKGACPCMTMVFLARNCQMLQMLWAGALLWWSSYDLPCYNSRLFFYSQWSIYCMISWSYLKIHVTSPVNTLHTSVVQFKDTQWCPDTTCIWHSFWSSFRSLGPNFV